MAKILVIDDNEVMRAFAAECLRAEGHEVIEAEDGAQGLALAESERPVLVLTDVMMPGIHGYGVVEAVGMPVSSLKISRSDGWNVVTGTLFRSSSRSTTWLRIMVRSCATEIPSSSAASASEYWPLPGLLLTCTLITAL